MLSRINAMGVLFAIAALMALALVGGLVLYAILENPGSNSYALLAEAFLNGRLDTTTCYDGDCARFEDKIFVMFPPVPAIIALPFVALFGVDFSGFVLLSGLAFALSVWLWWRIFEGLKIDRDVATWLLLGIAFATPLYFVTIRGDGVWFFAQAIGFAFTSLAIHQLVRGGSLVLAGACIGAAFLCRQMAVFYLPFLFALALDRYEPLISFRREHIIRALKLGLPVAVAVLVYLAYNYFRFGDPMQTGYPYMMGADISEGGSMINYRLAEHGLWSTAYLLFNTVYMFLQGFHLEFGGNSMVDPVGLDAAGTAILAASPFVLFAFFAPMRRPVLIGIATILVIAVPTLFYHSNGYSQYNVQRYALDWLPIVFYLLALAVSEKDIRGLALLVTYGIGLNLATMTFLALGLAA
ncbi:hypothetical protein NO932_03190 [Pelagibacterium sp. 26DY04]|uniref:hypothetical protein n=1 Tax=Pelagibacterium sp. 26DY04 TaxID=2967130 RepID=UPI002815E682|nr:hypothetical protein [Pelagibacterium sp. 26DY04]WMT87627.1 hypothetical protein NO932_03190 [Pelagibacterium sp. 26DY04]